MILGAVLVYTLDPTMRRELEVLQKCRITYAVRSDQQCKVVISAEPPIESTQMYR